MAIGDSQQTISLKLGGVVHYRTYITFGLGEVKNKYLIWFDWDLPFCLSDAAEAVEYIAMRE